MNNKNKAFFKTIIFFPHCCDIMHISFLVQISIMQFNEKNLITVAYYFI